MAIQLGDPLAKIGEGVNPPYHMSEETALKAISSYDDIVIVDLDETLYLQNSTTNFLDTASPGFIAMIMLKILNIIAPWRFCDERTRDAWRVWLILHFPSIVALWRMRCQSEADMLTNKPLLKALRARGKPFVIATNGFYPIVEPLLKAMGCTDATLIACHLHRPADRIGGKANLVRARLGQEALNKALFITDSLDDTDLLHCVRRPCLTRWKAASNPRLFGRVYLPGIYTAVVKRSTQNGMNTVRVNQMFWLLAPLTAEPIDLRVLAAAFPFFWSFWAVYEAGYRDNDICASIYEDDPMLSPAFVSFRQKNFELKAWLFALSLGAIGVVVLGASSPIGLFAGWLGLLLITRGTFWLYNRFDKSTRVWFYLPMQLQREAGFLVFASASFVGVSAVVSRAIAKWIEYVVYRYARTVGVKGFTKMPLRFYRLFVYSTMIGAAALSGVAFSTGMIVASSLFFLLFLFNARTEIAAAVKAGYRLDIN